MKVIYAKLTKYRRASVRVDNDADYIMENFINYKSNTIEKQRSNFIGLILGKI